MKCKSTLGYAFDPWEQAPLEQWEMDYVRPCKRSKEALYRFVFVSIDRTRWVEAMAACEATANTTVWCLCEVLNGCGPPILTDSDKGNGLTDVPLQKFLEGVGVHQLTHIFYHPQSSRVVERANRSIKVRWKLIVEERELSWDEALLFVCWAVGTKSFPGTAAALTGWPVALPHRQTSSVAMPANSRVPPTPIRSWSRVQSAESTGPCHSPESHSSGEVYQ